MRSSLGGGSGSRAWITGSGGLLGSHLLRSCPPEWQAIGLTRQELDLADFPALRARFAKDEPELVIHCAAISKAEQCAANPDLAWRINRDVTRVLAELAADVSFIFLSTDLVFDGRRGNYNEDDAPSPLTLYGETKAAAEQAVLKSPNHLVIRTSLNGGHSPQGNRSFSEQLIRTWETGKVCRLFEDEFRSPLMAEVTARAIWELARHRAHGLLHVAGTERLSRHAIGQLIARFVPRVKPRIEATSLQNYAGPPRAPDTSLDSSKAQQWLSFPLPGLTDWFALHGASHLSGCT